MDFGDISETLPLIISVVVLLLFQYIARKKRPANANNSTIVQSLISDISMNIRLADYFNYSKPGKKFTDASWKLYQDKLDFLDQPVKGTLTDAYLLIDEYNQQISSAKKYKSTSYLSALDMSKLKQLLEKSQRGLEEWFSANAGTESPTRTPGLFG